MVGLALVVFVSVFAAGLKDSIDGAIADRAKADLVVTSDTVAPLSRAAGPLIDRVPTVVATAPQYLDQVQVNGRKVDTVTDQLNGIDPLALRDVYRFHWLQGSDADLQRVVGGAAIVEEQFAKLHGITVGHRFRITGPTGRSGHAHGDRRVPRPAAHAGRDGRRRRSSGPSRRCATRCRTS